MTIKALNASEVPMDLSIDNLHDIMIKYYKANIMVNEVSAEQININTMGQSSGEFEQLYMLLLLLYRSHHF